MPNHRARIRLKFSFCWLSLQSLIRPNLNQSLKLHKGFTISAIAAGDPDSERGWNYRFWFLTSCRPSFGSAYNSPFANKIKRRQIEGEETAQNWSICCKISWALYIFSHADTNFRNFEPIYQGKLQKKEVHSRPSYTITTIRTDFAARHGGISFMTSMSANFTDKITFTWNVMTYESDVLLWNSDFATR